MTATLRHYVREAQRGDETAVEILFDQFRPLFRKHLGQYARHYRYSEDLQSSIHSAAFLCIMDFDLEKPGTVQQAMQMSIHNFLERESYHMEKYNSNIQKNVEDENGGLTDLPEGVWHRLRNVRSINTMRLSAGASVGCLIFVERKRTKLHHLASYARALLSKNSQKISP